MGLDELRDEELKLILFGGKGGVGKTTCTVATGIYLSKYFKTLLISTDPAHSLSDSLSCPVKDEVTEIKGIKNLHGLEINAEKVLAKFKVKYEKEIKKILDTSTYLDQQDIDSIFSLSIPGIDEVMGFRTIVDLIDEGNFDKYIVDTAPTGHALRLLNMPGVLDDWVKVMAKMRWKYRYLVETFAGKYAADEGDDFLVDMKKTVKRIEGLLRDEKRCEFIPVTIPEDMAISETEKLIKTLDGYGINVKQLIINNVLESGNCEFCKKRKKEQEKYIYKIKEKFDRLKITIVFLQPEEVKGLDTLDNFKGLLFNEKR